MNFQGQPQPRDNYDLSKFQFTKDKDQKAFYKSAEFHLKNQSSPMSNIMTNQSFAKTPNQLHIQAKQNENAEFFPTGNDYGTNQMGREFLPTKLQEKMGNMLFQQSNQAVTPTNYRNIGKEQDRLLFSTQKRLQHASSNSESPKKKRFTSEGMISIHPLNQTRATEAQQNTYQSTEQEFVYEDNNHAELTNKVKAKESRPIEEGKSEQLKSVKNNLGRPQDEILKTNDLVEKFYQTLNEVPQQAQEKLQTIRTHDCWNIGLDETKNFFNQLPYTSMYPAEFINEEGLNIQPHEIDLPNDVLEKFQRDVQNSTFKLQRNLSMLNDLFLFSQKVGRLFGDKTNQVIYKSKEISGAFSNLSSYIWDYIQKQFCLPENDFSQDLSFDFQDVAEKITSQNFFSEINNTPELATLLNSFNMTMHEDSSTEDTEIKNYATELAQYDLLDEELIEYLFGPDFELPEGFPPMEKNTNEEKLKNQYMKISQDIAKFSRNQMEEKNISLLVEEIFRENDSEQEQESQERHERLEMLERHRKNLQKDFSNCEKSLQARVTQITDAMASMTNQSEFNPFQNSNLDFDGYAPGEFEEEDLYMPSFPFGMGDQFGEGNSAEEEEND